MSLTPRPRPSEADIEALLRALNEVERLERTTQDALSAEIVRAMSLLDEMLAATRAAA